MVSISPKSRLRGCSEGTLVVLLLAVAAFLYWPALYAAGSRMDEATLLVYPELILQGKIAYRDFETFYPPANLCTLAAAFRIFGVSITTERVVGIVYRLALFAGLYVAARNWGKIAAAGVVAIAAFVLLPLYFANAWIMALALSLGSLSLLTRSLPLSTRFGIVIAGLMGGLAILFRVDIAPGVIVSAAVVLLCLQPGKWLIYALGLVLGCAPLLFWVVKAGVRQVIENLFLYPVVYSSPGRRLPLFGENAEIPFYLCVIVSAAILLLVSGAVATSRKRGESNRVLLLALGCLGVCVTPQVFQRAEPFHAAMVAPVTIALLPVLAAAPLVFKNRAKLAPLLAGLMTLACFSILFSICPGPSQLFDQSLHNELVRSEAPECIARGSGERRFPLSSPIDAQSVTRICAALTYHSRNGERLFVGPRDLRQTNYNDVYFYYLLPQLAPSTYFIEMNPLSANRSDSRLGNDISHADWLILDSQLNESRESNASLQLGPDAPNVVVRDQFVQVAQLNQFSIFHRRRDL
jgi:hypothetical protein